MGVFMVEILFADAEEIRLRRHPADGVQKLSRGFHAEADEVQILLHVLHLGEFAHVGRAHRLVKRVDIRQHVAARGAGEGLASPMLADLMEEPRVPDRAPPDHQTARAREREHFGSLFGRIHVAIRQHRTWELRRRARDEIVMHRAAIHLLHGAPMHGEQVERMLREDRQQFVEHRRVIEAQPGLYCEGDFHRIPKRPEDRINPPRLAQQTSARAFPVNDRRRTAEVQIDRGNRMLLQARSRSESGRGCCFQSSAR